MKVEVVTPEANMGDVVGDLNRRRGMILGMADSPMGKVSMPKFPWQKCLAMPQICVQQLRAEPPSLWNLRNTRSAERMCRGDYG